MPLAALQRQLQAVYEVDVDYCVDDFLVTDAAVASRMDRSANPRTVREKLLLHQEDDQLDLALYLDPTVVQHLTDHNPAEHLHAGNLSEFLIALEGVSHFIYVVWNARHGKRVSLLELELQAEVDKFVGTAMTLARQNRGRIPPALHGWLFDRPQFDQALEPGEQVRYRDASHYAGKYCQQLLNRYIKRQPKPGMLRELRRFYRYTRVDKIRHIDHCH